jgi:hypothetical protein
MIKNRVPISEKDEYMHEVEKYPRYHNESWYFNFIDRPNKVYFITRLSIHMDKKKARVLVLLVVDGKGNTYFKEIPLEKMPKNWEFDKKINYFCVKPMKQWRVKFEDRKFNLDVNYTGRFPIFDAAEVEDPIALLKKYGEDLAKVAAQEHYEQPMVVSGTIELKGKGGVRETRNIKALGHRDHSWGIRHWVQIDRWNWVSAQFENETINFFKSEVMGKTPQMGVIHSKDGDKLIIENVEVSTKTKDDGKTPVSSKFILTDKEGQRRTIESKTIFSMHLPLPSRHGITEIFEQVATFDWDGKEGDGISEYLISTRK